MASPSCCGCISLKRGSLAIGGFTFLVSIALFTACIILWAGSLGKESILGDDQLTQFALCISIALGIASVFLLCGLRCEKTKFIKVWLITDGGLIFYLVERAFHLSEIQNLSFLAFIGAFLVLSFFCYMWTVVDAFYLHLIKKTFNKDPDSEALTPVVQNKEPCNDNLYTELTPNK